MLALIWKLGKAGVRSFSFSTYPLATRTYDLEAGIRTNWKSSTNVFFAVFPSITRTLLKCILYWSSTLM